MVVPGAAEQRVIAAEAAETVVAVAAAEDVVAAVAGERVVARAAVERDLAGERAGDESADRMRSSTAVAAEQDAVEVVHVELPRELFDADDHVVGATRARS